jgi:DNA adenine methylase
MSRALTQPLTWHGGKHYLASRIIALMPPHTHYVEPYFGGGAVLLAKDYEGVSEVVNDRNADLTNFWRVLQDPIDFAAFRRLLSVVPFSETEWEESDEVPRPGFSGRVAAAANFFISCRQSLAGRMQQFASLSRTRTRRGMNEQASAWLQAVEGLPAVHERLRRVVILGAREANEVIIQQDGGQTLFYCDPPYLHETRASTGVYGPNEMDEAAHERLLLTLRSIAGRFLLSGYRSKLYDQFAAANGWRRHDFDLPNNAAGGKRKRRMVECVWSNF